MLERVQARIPRIFVGRQSELASLTALWEMTGEGGEHLVYVFLNAPGVGKTTLIHHFGQHLEAARRGLALHFRCKTDYASPTAFHRDLLAFVRRNVNAKRDLIQQFLEEGHADSGGRRDRRLADLAALETRIEAILDAPTIVTHDVVRVIDGLSWIIPVFFAADEEYS